MFRSCTRCNRTACAKKNLHTLPDSEIIAGSIKTQNHILTCLRAGVDIATMNPDLFFQMFKHPLTTEGLDRFAKDWRKVPL